MAVPALIDVPISACVASMEMTLRRSVSSSKSPFSFNTQVFDWGGEQWLLNFNLPPITSRAVASDWISFGVRLRGMYNCFLMGDPSAKEPRGVASGTPLVAAGNQVGNVLQTKGWTVSTDGIMKKGDYIQLGTGLNSRLHMVVEDADSDGTGLANLVIEPALRTSPLLNDPIVVRDAKGVFRMTNNDFSWTKRPMVYGISFTAEEVINA